MKMSLKWLNDFVDVSEFYSRPQELADLLTRAGLEVEDIQNKAKDFANVVVGHIKLKDKHPNADKLSLCQVEIAPGKIEQIVCGAQNHKALDKVIVALPGAVLPGNFAIKRSKIRDVESNGMLCSLKELGLATESDGLFILPPDATVGMPYAQYGGYDDIIFELKVTPNRADCLSHYGLAREIGCLINKPVKNPEVQTQFSKDKTTTEVKLKVEDSENCLRYCGRFIKNVKVGPSPDWLKNRLEALGLNSINNVVDVTNYVMHEMGQPLHAFDADLISGRSITVRSAKAQEKFKTLKEQDVTFSGGELLICDNQSVLALAGVIGGLNSGVSEKTTNIFLESANFKAMSVRKASRKHGIETDSAYRFSRGVDPSQTAQIMDRAVALILKVAGGEAFGDAHDIYPNPVKKAAVTIQLQTLTDRLGYLAEAPLFEQFMKGLYCQIEKIKDDKMNPTYQVTPPLFRFDLEHEMDLVEEYARLKGYEHITETLPLFGQTPARHDQNYMTQTKMSLFLRSQGFHQAFNYAFTSEVRENKLLGSQASLYTAMGLQTDDKAIRLKNPLNEDLNIMRRSLFTDLWKNITENFHAGNSKGQLFEIGSVFRAEKTAEQNNYLESRRLILVMWGEEFGVYANQTPLVYKLKSTCEKLFQSLKISAFSFADIHQAPPFLHKGQCAQINVEGKNIGYIGSVHPVLLNEEKIRVPVAVMEIHLDQLLAGQPRPVKFKSISVNQPVERDFAFVIDAQKKIGDLTKEIKKSIGANCLDVTCFDVYEGDKLAAGQKSVALRVILSGGNEALTEAMINEDCKKVVLAAEKSVGAKLR